MIGNNGDDDFASASGEDVIDGGHGEDTYLSPSAEAFTKDVGKDTINIAILMDVTALKWRYDSYTGKWIEDVEGVDDGYSYEYVRLKYDFPDPYDDRYTYLKNIEKFEFSPVYDAHDTIITTGNYDDRINAGNYNDIVRAGGGNDTIIGGRGEDQLYGEDGNDDIEGKGGNDIIDGGPGNDTIRAGKGQDYITGGKGNDIIAGGGNGDVFHVYLGSHAKGETNRHIVTDFHWETDSSTGKPTSDSDTVNIGDTRDDAITALTTLRFSNAHYSDLAPDGITIPEKSVDDDRTIKDILIFNTMGTASEADDILVMVLLDFVTDQVMDIDSTLFTHNLVA